MTVYVQSCQQIRHVYSIINFHQPGKTVRAAIKLKVTFTKESELLRLFPTKSISTTKKLKQISFFKSTVSKLSRSVKDRETILFLLFSLSTRYSKNFKKYALCSTILLVFVSSYKLSFRSLKDNLKILTRQKAYVYFFLL